MKEEKYFAFVSSLTKGADGQTPLAWRRQLHELSDDSGVFYVDEFMPRNAISAATGSDRDFPKIQHLKRAISQSECVILVLTERFGRADFGTVVHLGYRFDAYHDAFPCSFVELEVLTAVAYRKPLHVVVESGFAPGPRLAGFLALIRQDLDLSQYHVVRRSSEIVDLARRLRHQSTSRIWKSIPRFHALLRSSRRPETLRHEGTYLYLAEAEPDLSLRHDVDLAIESVVAAKQVNRADDKLIFLWQARRALGVWSVTAAGVPKDAKLTEALVQVLDGWSSAAAWCGLHGVTRLGQIESLSELTLLSKHPSAHAGGLSSAFYSLAFLTRNQFERQRVLRIAAEHAERGLNDNPLNDGILGVKASISFWQFRWLESRNVYRKVLDLRVSKGSPEAIGEAKTELALAEAACLQVRRALRLAEEGVLAIPDTSQFKPRALRKLAVVRFLHGHWKEAKKAYDESKRLATALGQSSG